MPEERTVQRNSQTFIIFYFRQTNTLTASGEATLSQMFLSLLSTGSTWKGKNGSWVVNSKYKQLLGWKILC